jgi:hypothetical protein
LVHTAHWSDDERVYYQYQSPNWEWNEIGDALGADHMNRVFVGYSWVEESGVGGCTDPDVCNYNAAAGFDDGTCANVIGTQVCGNGQSGCDCNGVCFTYIDQPLQVIDCNGICGGGAVQACNVDVGGDGDCLAGDDICTQQKAIDCEDNDDDPNCSSDCDEPALPGNGGDVNSWSDCTDAFCGTDDPLFYPTGCADAGYIPCDGGRCYTCSNPAYTNYADCAGAAEIFEPATVGNCNESDYPCADVITDAAACGASVGTWVPFTYLGNGVSQFDACMADPNCEDLPEPGGPDECKCSAVSAEANCERFCCGDDGDTNCDGGWNVLDIVVLANCILANNCGGISGGCAGDVNGDGGWNVLDIVTLANCVLADNCNGRVDDASEASLIKKDNQVSFEADGFIGGVQMTLTHGSDFIIEMTDRALFADYLTTGNETRLLVITPETDELFSFMGEFEITEVIVANSQYEVSVNLPLAGSFSLGDAYPNPFNPTTTMTLTMPVSGDMTVEVYNLLGQVVTTLASGYMEASTTPYTLTWDASNVSSGVYFVQADAAGFTKTQKLMLVK